jgi:hypothetical protein
MNATYPARIEKYNKNANSSVASARTIHVLKAGRKFTCNLVVAAEET